LNLEEAIRVALQNNPGLRVAVENRERAADRVDEVRAATLPQVNASGAYTVQGPVSTIEFQMGDQTQSIDISPKNVFRGQVSATLDTDIAGRQRSLRRIATLGVRAAEDDVNREQNDLIFAVQTSYLEALRSEALVRVAVDAVGVAREQLRVAEAQFRAGVVPQFDVLRSSVQVENLRQAQIGAENRERLAKTVLIQVLGIDPTTRLALSPLVPPVPEAGVPEAAPAPPAPPGALPPSLQLDIPQDLGPALALAYARRPELQQIEESLQQARERVEFEKKARRPNIFVNGNYNFTPDASGFSATETSWDVTASLAFPIFTGGLIRSRVRGAQNELDALVAQQLQLRQAVARDVRTALLNYYEADSRRGTTAANSEQAREALRIARVRYQAGVSTPVEVTDATLALTTAQVIQVNAEYDLLSARAAVLRSLGHNSGATADPASSRPPM
jgi:outer membrane protein TolC